MSLEVIFRGGVAVVSVLLALIRFYYGWQARQSDDRVAFKKASSGLTALVWMFGLSAAGASAVYVVVPQWLAWLPLSCPRLGAGLA